MPNIIPRVAYFFDVYCTYDPAGTKPGDDLTGVLRIGCRVRRIAAYDHEQAAEKAITFLEEQKAARNVKVKSWNFSKQQRGLTDE